MVALPPSPAPPGRRWLLPVVAAIVAGVVVVASLFAFGIVHLGSGSSPASYQTFSQAESTASRASGGTGGGPWFAVAGVALVTPVAVIEPATNLSSLLALTNCTFVWPHGQPMNVEVPATPASASIGASAYWDFVLKNGSNALLVESVSDGSASQVVVATGGTCAEVGGALVSFPSGVVDSPVAIQAANAAGGSAFLNVHPNATQAWAVVGGVAFGFLTTSPEWFVEYSSCSFPTSSNTSGAVYNATVGGSSGVVTNHSTGTTACAPTIPTGFTLGFPAGASTPAARKAI